MADIKGRLAEALVEQLFWKLGWKVYRFGIEHTSPHLFEAVRRRDDPVSLDIRTQPDFVIHKEPGQPFFVEVKYRADGFFSKEQLPPGYAKLTTFIVLVSPHRIECATVSELLNGVRLGGGKTSAYWLANRPEFGIVDPREVKAFVELAGQLFKFDRE